jgi:hypothetical protein
MKLLTAAMAATLFSIVGAGVVSADVDIEDDLSNHSSRLKNTLTLREIGWRYRDPPHLVMQWEWSGDGESWYAFRIENDEHEIHDDLAIIRVVDGEVFTLELDRQTGRSVWAGRDDEGDYWSAVVIDGGDSIVLIEQEEESQ